MAEWRNGNGMVEWWNGRMVELGNDGWNGGMVKWSNGGNGERNGQMEWLDGGY